MAGSGLAVDLDVQVSRLTVGERQRVEILKALYRDARILVLDEPTAVLTPTGGRRPVRHRALAGGRRPGGDLHLPQARRGAGGVAPHRRAPRRPQGRRDGDRRGRPAPDRRDDGRPRRAGEPAHAARAGTRRCSRSTRVSVGGGHRRGLEDASLAVAEGEIVGIAGVSGNGQAALAVPPRRACPAGRRDHAPVRRGRRPPRPARASPVRASPASPRTATTTASSAG